MAPLVHAVPVSTVNVLISLFFKVILFDASGTNLGAQTFGADHTSHMFIGLFPGRLYRSEVITHSGELTNSISALGRTCECGRSTQTHEQH